MPKSRNPSATATKKTKPALSPKTSAAKATKKVAKSGVLGKVLSGADQKSIEAREIINSQISHMVYYSNVGKPPYRVSRNQYCRKGNRPKPKTIHLDQKASYIS